MRTLQRIVEHHIPDHLYIEPSGIASPSSVLESLRVMRIAPVTVVGLVDATEFIEFYESQMYGDFFLDQITNSDVILVNKTDLVDEDRVKGTTDLISTIHGGAIIYTTVRAAFHDDLPHGGGREIVSVLKNHAAECETLSFIMDGETEFASVDRIFEDLARDSFGRIMRAKGLVQTERGPYRFDLSSGRIDVTSFTEPVGEGRIVVIGKGLRGDTLRKSVESLFSR